MLANDVQMIDRDQNVRHGALPFFPNADLDLCSGPRDVRGPPRSAEVRKTGTRATFGNTHDGIVVVIMER